ncbi:hypothetical protein BMR1_02g03105 [Babesia microti strain RI]|uniref:Uncharacterized protein n=1 Tax=Babesia microti (strain RI) TaxID=1133968 RepID=I7JAG9_BABMR|nr:hypothetical protein BMR1_02g03105 [Babesia microti strain RI]CCF73774.1 hypothetical protein BMR1_02g03105 [Babesia microti strain RI]|eukprot:XP_012648383.1 hypothetical protein BMR1_02g03105 [Babesia microti strain RI]
MFKTRLLKAAHLKKFNSDTIATSVSRHVSGHIISENEMTKRLKNLSEKFGNKSSPDSVFNNPNIVRILEQKGSETFSEKLYRYCDIFGWLSSFSSRKIYALKSATPNRVYLTRRTEAERKHMMMLAASSGLMTTLLMLVFIDHCKSFWDRMPMPEAPTYEFTNGRRNDFTWHGSMPFQYPKGRCKHCRFLELECKKDCYDRLKRDGHTFIFGDPFSKPRRVLLPSPYPPISETI